MEAKRKRLKSIGYALARERKRQGLTQTQLAAMVGISGHAYISRIENGKKAPSLDRIFQLADALDVSVNYFFTEI